MGDFLAAATPFQGRATLYQFQLAIFFSSQEAAFIEIW